MDPKPTSRPKPRRRFSPGLLFGPLLSLLSLWISPRMLLWFASLTALGLAARVPFLWTPPVPGAVDFNPGLAFFPVAAIFSGPAAACAAAASLLIGDHLLGGLTPLSWYRAGAAFLFAWSAGRLWETRWRHDDAGVTRVPTWGRTVRSVLAVIPGGCAATALLALGIDRQQLYPFAYTAPILLAVHLVFTVALTPALYRVIAREWTPRYRTWREALPRTGRSTLAPGGALLAWTGGVGSLVTGFNYSQAQVQLTWRDVPCLGATTDPFLVWEMLPWLALLLVGLLWSHFVVSRPPPSAPAPTPAPEPAADAT